MITTTLDIVSILLMLCGLFFFVVGTVGLLRLPDFYTRLHATGKCDTFAAMLTLTGLATYYFNHHVIPDFMGSIRHGAFFTFLKILLILCFTAMANSTATHALGRAALKSGLKPWTLRSKK